VVDYISRALVADALAEWREHLRHASTVSPLRDLAASDAPTLDLQGSHPSGLAQFFAHRPTYLSTLARDEAAFRTAAHRADLILTDAERVLAATGVWTVALVVGTAAWDGQEMPLIVRTVTMERIRDTDVTLVLHPDAHINPVFAGLVRERGALVDLEGLAAASIAGPQFDPRPTWHAVRELAYLFGAGFEVRERLLVGAFDDPEQRLRDDLDALDPVMGASDVIAAAAGDMDARTILAEPLPRTGTADRDPFGERGAGDLDDVAFAALDAVATGRSVAVTAAPGSDPVGFVAALAADAAASGRTVAVVAGTEGLVEAVGARLDALGLGEIYVSGAPEDWNAQARARLLASLTLDATGVDEDYIRALGSSLVQARHEVTARYEALHRPHRPWGVSAFEAVQAVVRLTAGAVKPGTTIRLGGEAGAVVAEHGLAGVAAAMVRRLHGEDVTIEPRDVNPATAAIEAATTRPTVPWWSELVSPEQGAHLDEALAVLVRNLPPMRAEAAQAARETGLDEAESLAAWAEQVTLFTAVRSTLDTFSPAVYQRSLLDLVAATAPEDSPRAVPMPRAERRSLVRRAEELLRPGREGEPLHERLLAAQEETARWRAHCSAGGWPVVPDAFDAYAARLARVQAAWSVFVEYREAQEAEELALCPWGDLMGTLERLADGIPGGIDHAPVRPAEVDLGAPGFAALLASLDARGASAEQIRVDLEFAWWAAAFDSIVEASPELTDFGALGVAVETYLAYDAAFADARVGPLLRAVGERRRAAIARHPAFARDLFAMLVEGVGGTLRDLWRDMAPVVTALRPVVVAHSSQVARMLPPTVCVDTVVVVGAESLAFAQVVPAVARGAQVVWVGDAASATRSAATTLAPLLPELPLHALPQRRDPRVTRVLAESLYGKALTALPAPGEATGSQLHVVHIDAVASAAVGAQTVESSRAEVAAVVEMAVRAAGSVPRRTVTVVAGNELHAARMRDALLERDVRVAERTPVVVMGDAAGHESHEVILALGYARDSRGVVPSHLGVLSSSQGAAALAQAVVVGREALTVVTALEPHHLTAVAAASEVGHGVAALRELIMAQERPVVAPERPRPGPSDWLLADVAAILRAEGLAVHLRYGWDADTIPMVVGGPHDRGYRVAVVTDEAAPGGATLRDRVRWQYARLEALGWTVVSLWTVDVFVDPVAAARQVREALAAVVDDVVVPEVAVPDVVVPGAHPEPEEVEPVADEPVVDEPVADEQPDSDEPSADHPTPAPRVTMTPTRGHGSDRPLIPTRAWEDEDAAWQDRSGGNRAEDIKREKPPHW